MQKKKKRVPEFQVPVSDLNIWYFSGSHRSVSDPNLKLQYPGITRTRPEYKTTRIRIRKNGYLHYPYPILAGYTRPVFTPIHLWSQKPSYVDIKKFTIKADHLKDFKRLGCLNNTKLVRLGGDNTTPLP